jgi:hypothetical protein
MSETISKQLLNGNVCCGWFDYRAFLLLKAKGKE